MISTFVSGRNMTVGEALTQHVDSTIQSIERRYFGEFITTRVTFKKEAKGIRFTCAIQLTCSHGNLYTSSAKDPSPYNCFNRAATHITCQLRRMKTALNDDKPVNLAKTDFS
jgi:ribosomal subunit interface protein